MEPLLKLKDFTTMYSPGGTTAFENWMQWSLQIAGYQPHMVVNGAAHYAPYLSLGSLSDYSSSLKSGRNWKPEFELDPLAYLFVMKPWPINGDILFQDRQVLGEIYQRLVDIHSRSAVGIAQAMSENYRADSTMIRRAVLDGVVQGVLRVKYYA